MNVKKKTVVGIDVSKATFNAHWNGTDAKYSNDRKGWKKLLSEAPPDSGFGMEATGNYHYRLAAFLHSKGCGVMVFNPYKVRSFANSSEGGKAKTDKIDARDVSELCSAQQDDLEKELCALAKELWPQKFALLNTVKGIGPKTAAVMLVCCRGLDGFASHKKLSSFVGLAPDVKESGTSVKGTGKIKKVGNAYLRGLLYMCAHSAQMHNEPCASYYGKLLAEGKPKDKATVAVMHKLVKIAFAVVQSGEPCRGGKKLKPT